jgi:hypothetical protein
MGGAVQLNCSVLSKYKCIYNITNSTFTNNEAVV